MNTKHTSLSTFILLRRIIVITVILCSAVPYYSGAQQFWTEPFGTGCNQGQVAGGTTTANGTWTLSITAAEDPFANQWYISATESGSPPGGCRDGCILTPASINQTLHVGNVAGSTNSGVLCLTGDCGAIYDPGGFPANQVTTHKLIQSPVINCTGRSGITIDFNYFENGDSTFDNATLWYYNGTAWSQIADPPKTSIATCSAQGTWTAFHTSLPASSSNNPNVKIGFQWDNNDDATGTSPSFVVDDITLTSQVVPVVASFTVDSVTGGCAGFPRHFTDLSSGIPTSWFWVFSGGVPAFSTSQNPTVTYAFPGTYSVTLAAYNAVDTDTISITNYITIVNCQAPTTDFVASDSVICQNHCIDFTDLSQGNPTSWLWSFTGATPSSSTVQNPSNICYAFPGTFPVQLIATNSSGSNTISKNITVNNCPPPTADFGSSTTTGCDTVCIDFFDLSSGSPDQWHWYFPGATPDSSAAQNPTNICYSSDGLYDVTLVASNGNGTDTITRYSYIRISSVPTATINSDTTMYFGSSYQLQAGGGLTYYWFSPGLDSTQLALDTNYIPNPIATPHATTTYYCLIGDGLGCFTIRQVVVKIVHDNRLFIPNSFSPNNDGDGRNEIFRINGNNIFSASLTVFDRWGTKVFETQDKDTGWDGTYNGKKLNVGVYTYVAVVVFSLKEGETGIKSETRTGTVALIR